MQANLIFLILSFMIQIYKLLFMKIFFLFLKIPFPENLVPIHFLKHDDSVPENSIHLLYLDLVFFHFHVI